MADFEIELPDFNGSFIAGLAATGDAGLPNDKKLKYVYFNVFVCLMFTIYCSGKVN